MAAKSEQHVHNMSTSDLKTAGRAFPQIRFARHSSTIVRNCFESVYREKARSRKKQRFANL